MLYHVWSSTKYREKTLTGKSRELIIEIIHECAQRHGYDILESALNMDHMHLLLRAADKQELSAIVRTLKAVSAREVLKVLRENGRGQEIHSFWARRFGWKEEDESAIPRIKRYFREQDR